MIPAVSKVFVFFGIYQNWSAQKTEKSENHLLKMVVNGKAWSSSLYDFRLMKVHQHQKGENLSTRSVQWYLICASSFFSHLFILIFRHSISDARRERNEKKNAKKWSVFQRQKMCVYLHVKLVKSSFSRTEICSCDLTQYYKYIKKRWMNGSRLTLVGNNFFEDRWKMLKTDKKFIYFDQDRRVHVSLTF